MSRSPLRGCAAGVVCAALLPLAACTTTQERSAALAQNAATAAKAERFNVGRTNRDVKAAHVTTLKGDGTNAVVVEVRSSSPSTQVMVPIGLDLYDAKGGSIYSNRVDGLDAPLNNIPVVSRGTTWWVNNQVPGTPAHRTRVRIGTSKARPPKALPEMKISGVTLDDDEGVPVAQGKVENLSPIEQKRLTIMAVARKDGRVVAAGRAVVEKLGAKGARRQRFSIYFTGDPTGAELEIAAPPSTLGGA